MCRSQNRAQISHTRSFRSYYTDTHDGLAKASKFTFPPIRFDFDFVTVTKEDKRLQNLTFALAPLADVASPMSDFDDDDSVDFDALPGVCSEGVCYDCEVFR